MTSRSEQTSFYESPRPGRTADGSSGSPFGPENRPGSEAGDNEEENRRREAREKLMRDERIQQEESRESIQRLLLERAADKLILGALPEDPVEYLGWRFQLSPPSAAW